jgi:transposase
MLRRSQQLVTVSGLCSSDRRFCGRWRVGSNSGCASAQKELWSYQVNLDTQVRSDHPLRRINETLELDFVRREVAQFYGTKCDVSEDPVVIMKMMLLLFLDNVRSERELMRIIPERLDYMWFLGYGLDDTVPNHSVLSKARKRWSQEVFVALYSRVVAHDLVRQNVENLGRLRRSRTLRLD